jgi:hypothetical protein
MKSLLIKTLTCCFALLPFAQVQAAGAAGKTFGGFAAGAKFQMTVKEAPVATVASIRGGGLVNKIPAGFPNYRVGTKVNFKIGAKGDLVVAKFSIPLSTSSESSNTYSPKKKADASKLSQAGMSKNAGKPIFMNLVLRKATGSGMSTKVTQVVYLLE